MISIFRGHENLIKFSPVTAPGFWLPYKAQLLIELVDR